MDTTLAFYSDRSVRCGLHESDPVCDNGFSHSSGHRPDLRAEHVGRGNRLLFLTDRNPAGGARRRCSRALTRHLRAAPAPVARAPRSEQWHFPTPIVTERQLGYSHNDRSGDRHSAHIWSRFSVCNSEHVELLFAGCELSIPIDFTSDISFLRFINGHSSLC